MFFVDCSVATVIPWQVSIEQMIFNKPIRIHVEQRRIKHEVEVYEVA